MPEDTSLLTRSARRIVSKALLNEANRLWAEHPLDLDEAIDKAEQAWTIGGDPMVAVQLASMYDQTNRNDDALVVLKQAFRRHPLDPLVRHHAAITLLRHGAAADIRDFFDSVVRMDPADAFARYATSLLDRFERWVEVLVAEVERRRDGRTPFIVSCPVWGQPFARNFVQYLCAALLASGNLPALAARHRVHFVVFTTRENEGYLRTEPLFERLSQFATVHFMHFEPGDTGYGSAMTAAYRATPVFYSSRTLDFYYARNCKFLLMSCAHYVALAAGRRTESLVSCQVADTLLSDGSLARIAELLSGPADAVLVNSMQLEGATLRDRLERTCRRADGSITIPPDVASELIVSHLPDNNFATAANLPRIPLRMTWRVGAGAVLVHGNHYHPMGLRPAAFAHPLHLSIDPIDSRFVDRSSLELDRVHLVQDSSISALSIEDGPLEEQLTGTGEPLSVEQAAFWLWGYWGRTRAALFRSPLRIGTATAAEWQAAESVASSVVESILTRARAYEDRRRRKSSWRL